MHRIVFLFISLELVAPLVLADSIDSARTSVSDWVLTERTISRESIDWQTDKALLIDMIAIAEKRVARLQGEVDEQESFKSLAQEERRKLNEQDSQIDATTQAIETFLAQTENKLRALKPQLPEPLANEIAVSLKRFPDADTALSINLSERMQTVTQLLTQIRDFDSKISITQTTRTLPGTNEEVALRTIWVGLGHAYYLAPNDAGYGIPSSNGWQWHTSPNLQDAIKDSIQQLEGTSSTPQLIDLPIHIKGFTLEC